MNETWNNFARCKLIFRGYFIWKTDNQNIRQFHLKVAKKDLEIARAFLNVERKRRVYGV